MVAPQGDYINVIQEGMTLRDWFAGQALAAVGWESSNPAEAAYHRADMMLAERAKRKRHEDEEPKLHYVN